MRFILKILKHLSVLLLLKIWIQIFGLIILAVVLPFIPRSAETLPKIFRWWDNNEIHVRDDGDDGLLGPPYYREERGTTDKYAISRFKLFYERYIWLALRNPANYFQYSVLGLKITGPVKVLYDNGNVNVGTHDWSDYGTYKLIIEHDGKEYFEYYVVKPYPFLGGKYGIRFRVGWKIRNPHDDPPGKIIQWVFSINPVRRMKD